jgi:hypothetical protein
MNKSEDIVPEKSNDTLAASHTGSWLLLSSVELTMSPLAAP